MNFIKSFLSPVLPPSYENILNLYIDATDNLKALYPLQCICRSLYMKINTIFTDFRLIPIMGISEKYSERQKRLIITNSYILARHSSWFVSFSLHDCLSICNFKGQEGSRVDCSKLGCPVGCSDKLTISDNLFLLDTKLNINIANINKICNKIISSCNIYHMLPIMLFKCHLNMDIYRYVLNDRTVTFESYMALKQFASIDPIINMKFDIIVNNIDDIFKNRIKDVLTPIAAILHLLKHKTHEFINVALKHLGNSIYINEAIESIHFVKHEISILKITTKHYNYFAVSQCGLNAYVINNCIKVICVLSGLPIVTPNVLLIGMYDAILRLPSGASDDLKNLYTRFGRVAPFSNYAVVCYLFGIKSSVVMVTYNAIINILYDKLYEDDYIRLANIINELGGRSSDRYKEFRAECSSYYSTFRRYYKHVILFMDILKIPRKYIDAKFRPLMSNKAAVEEFNKDMDRNEEKSLAIWRYVGY